MLGKRDVVFSLTCQRRGPLRCTTCRQMIRFSSLYVILKGGLADLRGGFHINNSRRRSRSAEFWNGIFCEALRNRVLATKYLHLALMGCMYYGAFQRAPSHIASPGPGGLAI